MNRFERSCVKGRILNMAMLRATGTPAELAQRLDLSTRTVKRIVKELREEGKLLRFDYNIRSYKLEE